MVNKISLQLCFLITLFYNVGTKIKFVIGTSAKNSEYHHYVPSTASRSTTMPNLRFPFGRGAFFGTSAAADSSSAPPPPSSSIEAEHVPPRWVRNTLFPQLDVDVIVASTKSFVSTTTTAVRRFVDPNINQHHPTNNQNNSYMQQANKMLQSIPALIRRNDEARAILKTTEVSAVKTLKKRVAEPLLNELKNTGVYFGFSQKTLHETYDAKTQKKRVDLRDSMSEALVELRTMRQEMEAIRKEMQILQQQITSKGIITGTTPADVEEDLATMEELAAKKKKRKKEMEKISKDVEEWAKLMFVDALPEYSSNADTSSNPIDWIEYNCAKILQSKYNPNGQTRAFLTYMKDSRNKKYAVKSNYMDPDEEYPCIKMYSTLDAPIEEVCIYLSNEKYAFDYNSMIDYYEDIEVISSNSKVCFGRTPQVLFVKPKDFVTFCSYRWLKDGSQIVINQAIEHEKKNANAYALRGATIIRRHPDEPDRKTQIYMIAHAAPGNDVPMWAMKTAIKSLVPIEPFRLFHRINQGIQQSKDQLQHELERLREEYNNDAVEMVSSNGRPRKKKHWLPGGVAQLGYACFWPDGGGPIEVDPIAMKQQQQQQQLQYEQQETSTMMDTSSLSSTSSTNESKPINQISQSLNTKEQEDPQLVPITQ